MLIMADIINEDAHRLAKKAISLIEEQVCIEEVYHCIVNVIHHVKRNRDFGLNSHIFK